MLFGDRGGCRCGVCVCVCGGGVVVGGGGGGGGGGMMHNLFEWSVTDSLHCIDIV